MTKNNLITILGFKDIFHGEEMKKPELYLKGLKKDIIFKWAAQMASFKGSANKIQPNEFLSYVITDPVFLDEVKKKFVSYIIREHENAVTESRLNFDKSYSFIYTPSSLKLIEITLKNDWDQNYNEAENPTSQNVIGNQIFLAYLTITSELLKNEKGMFELIQQKGDSAEDVYGKFLLTRMLPNFDLVNLNVQDLFITQIIRSTMFLKFIDENYPKQLNEFLIDSKTDSWKEYLKKYIPIIGPIISKTNETYKVINSPNEDSSIFLNTLCIENSDLLNDDDKDFINLRSSPLIKLGSDQYLISFDNFVIDYIYRALYFKIKQYIDPIHRDFHTDFRAKFSEGILFYEIINSILEKWKIKLIGTGNRNDGAPDYYARNWNTILIFESKDILIDKETKHSLDFTKIQDLLRKKLYCDVKKNDDGSIRKKKEVGILQLRNSIRKILKNEAGYDKYEKPQKLKIYPILILHDYQFNTPGMNYLLNKWFTQAIKNLESENLNVSKVKPLIVIDIDSLILFEKYFKTESGFLNELDNYIDFLNTQKTLSAKRYLPFSKFVEKKFVIKKHFPERFYHSGLELFQN